MSAQLMVVSIKLNVMSIISQVKLYRSAHARSIVMYMVKVSNDQESNDQEKAMNRKVGSTGQLHDSKHPSITHSRNPLLSAWFIAVKVW